MNDRTRVVASNLTPARDIDEAYQQLGATLSLNRLDSQKVKLAQYDVDGTFTYVFTRTATGWDVGQPERNAS
jgi:hypothetical protein